MVIMMHILYRKGGVTIDSNMLLTGNLDWLYNTSSNPYINKLFSNTTTQVIAFYQP